MKRPSDSPTIKRCLRCMASSEYLLPLMRGGRETRIMTDPMDELYMKLSSGRAGTTHFCKRSGSVAPELLRNIEMNINKINVNIDKMLT